MGRARRLRSRCSCLSLCRSGRSALRVDTNTQWGPISKRVYAAGTAGRKISKRVQLKQRGSRVKKPAARFDDETFPSTNVRNGVCRRVHYGPAHDSLPAAPARQRPPISDALVAAAMSRTRTTPARLPPCMHLVLFAPSQLQVLPSPRPLPKPRRRRPPPVRRRR